MRKEPRIERGTSVQSLSGALASFGKIAREAIGKSNELGDAVSADIFAEISRGAEKWLWMVQAHLGGVL